MVILATLAHEGSFTRTADKLGISKSHVSKQISALEESLSCQLVQRSTRTVKFTDIGLQVAEYGDKLIRNVEEAEALVSGHKNEVSGTLRIAAAISLGSTFISSLIAEFKLQHPQLRIELSLFDHRPSLLDEGYDCWLAMDNELPESMVARKIFCCQFMAVASPTYLKHRASISHPNDLRQHNCISYASVDRSFEVWPFERDHEQVDVRVKGDIRIDNAPAIMEAAKSGLGIAYIATYLLNNEIHDGTLVNVLPGWTPTMQLTMYAVFPRRKHLAPKVRQFIDFVLTQHGTANSALLSRQ
ncbi:LysR substrate-binding domain-containing protein [Thaumasiovibrio sp. DFM-14]|uniref:LysR family transcriptional regulator n=1 Tax=Thaumasiovibrio sp. DFM-14 TaxID=3384792 RepID=UPI0039A1A8A9